MTTRRDDPMRDTLADPMQPSEPSDSGVATVVHVSYGPSTDNAEFNELASKLAPPRAPPPVHLPTTDGEMAARYDARDVRPPPPNATPVPEPPVLLNCTGDAELPDAPFPTIRTPKPLGAGKRVAPSAATTTIRIRRTKAPGLYVIVGLSLAVALVFLLVGFAKNVQRPKTTTQNGAAATPAPVQSSPASPSPSVQESTTAPGTASSQPDPAPASTSATPMSPPQMKSEHHPSRPAPPRASPKAHEDDAPPSPNVEQELE